MGAGSSRRDTAAQFSPSLTHVAHLRTVLGWPVERHFLQIFVADRHPETIPEGLQTFHVELLQRVGLVTCLARFAGPVTLDRHGENHRGSLKLLAGCRIGCINLVGIMTAPIQVHDVLVTEVLYQLKGLGILPEEVLSRIGATIELAVLKLAIADLIHNFLQQATLVPFYQGIPFAAPNHLDDLPSRTTENAFQFLNNFAVAADRSIESLKIAVHNKM